MVRAGKRSFHKWSHKRPAVSRSCGAGPWSSSGCDLFRAWQGDFTPEMLYCTDTNIDDQVEQLGVIAMLRLDVRNQIFGVPEGSRAQDR